MPRKPQPVSDPIQANLLQARVARLATVDEKGRPHIIPVCFAYDGEVFYTAVDRKPKRVAPQKLARLRNIRSRPQVALLIDQYDEDWNQLWHIQVRGQAKLLPQSAQKERSDAIRRLREKYPQYTTGLLPDDAPIIRIAPERFNSWGKIK